MRQMPSQKEGMDSPRAATTDTTRSTHVSCQYAAIRPRVTPSMTADGSPGAMRISTNAMMVTIHSTSARESAREAKKPVIRSALVSAPDVPEAGRRVEGLEALQAVAEPVEAEQVAVLDHRDVPVQDVLDLLVERCPRLAVTLDQRLLEERVHVLARVRLVSGFRLQHEGETARVCTDRERVVGNVPIRALLPEDIDHRPVVVRLHRGGGPDLPRP